VRPLKGGETRKGGPDWNFLKTFALTWTALAAWTLPATLIALRQAIGPLPPAPSDDLYIAGVVEFMVIGAIVAIWLAVTLGAVALGFGLRNQSVIEIGPTGPLAEETDSL
jgi:hypothetical protein